MISIRNERIRLLALNLDRLSTACVGIGVIGNALNVAPYSQTWISLLDVVIWLLAAFALHVLARHVLGKLR